MKRRMHAVFGGIAFMTILSFWLSSVISELFLSHQAVAAVKLGICYGLAVLIPAMAMTGASGMSLGKSQSRVVAAKKKRMLAIAINGLFVLVPAAVFLQHKAALGQFDTTFYMVQLLELGAGLTNLSLMAMSIRDGMLLTGRLRLARPAL